VKLNDILIFKLYNKTNNKIRLVIILKLAIKYLESHCIIIHSIKYQNYPCQNHNLMFKAMLPYLKPVTRSFNTS